MTATALAFELAELPEETFAFVVRRVSPADVDEFVAGAIGRVGVFAADHGGSVGPATAILTPPDDEGGLVVEAGWPVRAGTRPEGPVEVRLLPATRAVVHRHDGPYSELGRGFYDALLDEITSDGLTPLGRPRERYVIDRASGEKLLTEVVWPVVS